MRRMPVLMNPAAGTKSLEQKARALDAIVKTLNKNGVEATGLGLETENSEEFRVLAAQLARDYGSIAVVGGDGTFLDVMNSVKDDVVLGYIPIGTGNALKHNLDIIDVDDAIEKILRGNVAMRDLMLYNGDVKCFFAGQGIGADFIERLTNLRKELGLKGWPLIALAASASLIGYKRADIEIEVKDPEGITKKTVDNNLMTIVGTVPYGGNGIIMNPGPRPEGMLLVTSFNGSRIMGGLELLVGFNDRSLKGKEVRIKGPPQRYQCDGELMGVETDVELVALPKAVRMYA